MSEEKNENGNDAKVAELQTQIDTLEATLSATRKRVAAADAFAKAAGSEWDPEKEAYSGGLNFKEARSALKKVEELSKFDPKEEANELAAERIKLIEEKYSSELNDAISTREERIKELEQRISVREKDDSFREELLSRKIRPERIELLMALKDKRVKTDEKTLKPLVLTPTGEIDEILDPETKRLRPRTLAELADDYVKSYPDMFLGTDASGSGAQGNSTGNSVKPDRPVTDWSTKEKVEFIDIHGEEEFERLLA